MVFTFYSFKGGVGRSMTLVNIGEIFAQAGLRVLLVDFDLEAPSLETYYPDNSETILNSAGIVDLLESYKRAIASPGPLHQTADSPLPFEDIRTAMVNVWNDGNGGTIHLIPVGRRSDDNMGRYVNAVRGFDWNDFYDNWEGELYFRWLRQEFTAQADVTLIDCRTGITEAGGVCCGQLADAVVLFCAATVQQISGSVIMVSRLSDPRLAELRETPLKLLVVPSRIESYELHQLNQFKERFNKAFEKSVPEGVTCEDLWYSAIPFIPYYSFGNHIAVRESRNFDGLIGSYMRLAEVLSRLAPETSPLFQGRTRLRGGDLIS